MLSRFQTKLKQALYTGALLGAALVLFPSQAEASTAANTVIRNQASVAYNDAGGTAQTPVLSNYADVTITLVPSAPSISAPADQTVEQGVAANVTFNYTLTSNANGLDTYNLASVATPTSISTETAVPSVASLAIGGTTLAAAAPIGATSITVPYDGTNDSSVNGIAVGDVIVIGGNPYTVSTVTENPGTNTTSTIGLSTAIAGTAGTAGQIVGERRTFTVTIPTGTVSSGGQGQHSIATTATSATSPNPSASDTAVAIVRRAALAVTKQVSINSGSSFANTANAAPGTTLIYKIVITNSSTAAAASSVAITDALPPYLTYVTNSGRYATSSGTAYGSATTLTDGSGGFTYTAGTRTVAYAPGGGTGTVAANGGELVLFFSATVN